MKNYLANKVSKFASEPSYHSLISDERNIAEIADITGLDIGDIKSLRTKVMNLREELAVIENKEFVYGEMHTLIGVFKVKYGNQKLPAAPVTNRM